MPGAPIADYWEAQSFEPVFKNAEGILNSISERTNNTKGDTGIQVTET